MVSRCSTYPSVPNGTSTLRKGLPVLWLGKHVSGVPCPPEYPGLCVNTSKIGYSPLTPKRVLTLTAVQPSSPLEKSPFSIKLLYEAALTEGTCGNMVERGKTATTRANRVA